MGLFSGTGVYTATLTSKLTLTQNDGVFIIAILWVSGTVTVKGGQSLQGNNSTAINLSSTNTSMTIGTVGQNPLDNLVLDASSGNCVIICYF